MSAAFDYVSLEVKVQALIDRFGRAATLARAERPTATTPVAGKPWLSTSKGDADTAAAPAQSIPVVGVFTQLDKAYRDGSIAQSKTQTIIIGAELDQAIPEELGPDWTLTDGTSSWECIRARPLKPGPVLMLYKLEITV